MKLAMTALLPAEGFNDKGTCIKKVVGPMLDSIRAQLREQIPMKGEFRISILIDTLANAKTDAVAEAVHQSLQS